MKSTVFKILAAILIFTSTEAESQIIVPKRDNADILSDRPVYSFCISMLPTPNSGIICYGIHMMTVDNKPEINFVKFDTFIRQFNGSEPSRANPDRTNLLKKHGIDIQTIKDIWKLRYAIYPFGKSQEKGWGGQNGMPSEAQMQILAKYGIVNIGDVVYGENLIRLLTDMEDPTWLQIYKNAQK